MSEAPVTFRAGRGKPCPVCASETKNCSAKEDGAHFCRAPKEDRPGWKLVCDGAEWRTYRRIEDTTNLNGHGKNAPRGTFMGRPIDAKKHDQESRNWQADAERYATELTPALRSELAGSLALPVESLAALPLLGWCEVEKCWTFPESDATGQIIGITRRFRDATKEKKAFLGSHRGLTIAFDWKEKPGPVLIVEGASDVLALSACGACAIGRPSNVGGTEYLVDLLRDCGKTIVVVGENDARPSKTKPGTTEWPGKDGVESVAPRLAKALQREVKGAFPPGDLKDVRKWVNGILRGEPAAAYLPYGRIIADQLLERATSYKPELRFLFVDSAEFLAGDYRQEFLIPRILTRNQPGVFGGPSKTLKTSIALDAAVSMATATPFLGNWPVSKRVCVGFASGESGQFTLKETCLRILKAKGIEAAELSGWLKWEFTLPTLTDAAVMADFGKRLMDLGIEVAIIDPLYLCLGEVDAKSVFEMGRALRPVAESLLSRGVTPILSHHANRMLTIGAPMGLENLSHAGLAEFSRQWILLNRREGYQGDGNHDLWLTVGGSAGHGGLWNLHIEEGTADENFSGRRWDVTVQTASEVKNVVADKKAQAKQEATDRKSADEQRRVLAAIDAEVNDGRVAATRRRIKERTGLGYPKITDILEGLVEGGSVQEIQFDLISGNGAKKPTIGYQRVPA